MRSCVPLLRNRQTTDTDLNISYGNHRACFQILRALIQNILDQFAEFLRPQSFNPDTDHRRLEGLRQRKMAVEISVERYHCAIFKNRSMNNLSIFRLSQTNFARVNGIKTRAAKNGCR